MRVLTCLADDDDGDDAEMVVIFMPCSVTYVVCSGSSHQPAWPKNLIPAPGCTAWACVSAPFSTSNFSLGLLLLTICQCAIVDSICRLGDVPTDKQLSAFVADTGVESARTCMRYSREESRPCRTVSSNIFQQRADPKHGSNSATYSY